MSEFQPGVTDPFSPDELSPISRKQFLGLLAASAAFATAGCTNYRDKGRSFHTRGNPKRLLRVSRTTTLPRVPGVPRPAER